jgi:hypothetical protein
MRIDLLSTFTINMQGKRVAVRTSKGDKYQLDMSCNKHIIGYNTELIKKKLHGLSPRANYTDRATAAYRRSDCQLVRIEGATWSA